MSGEQMQQALTAIEPGEILGVLSYTDPNTGRVHDVCDFRVGNIPESSELDAATTKAYVATEPSVGFEQVVVALEDIHDGEAVIDAEVMVPSAENDVVLLRGVIREALSASDVRRGKLNPDSRLAELPPKILSLMGFDKAKQGGYELAAA